MRLDRYLAEAGKGTRSEVKKIIAGRRVSVNSTIVTDPGYKVKEGADLVMLDETAVRFETVEYFMLNKPQGVISATKDLRDKSQTCVTDLITDKVRGDLFPVGRLDKDTEGLLIITNDGDLAHRMLSPKKHVDKTYYAELDGRLEEADAERIMAGIDIGDAKPTLPCEINMLTGQSLLITIREGRYHQVKRMFQAVGRNVTALRRISMGPLTLDPDLEPGGYRRLTEQEIEMLKS
ncbi:MAG: rRNA pseudouridine synthase [Lachnospiraceae bacterium]|nr:rRNA pseudouridine synthase [Lachnospiraceae bacterium]